MISDDSSVGLSSRAYQHDLLAQRPSKQIHPSFGTEKAFGQALRELRESKKISQERLALDAVFDRTYISLVERGVRSPTIRAVVRLAQVLKLRPSEIVIQMEEKLLHGNAKTPKPRQQ